MRYMRFDRVILWMSRGGLTYPHHTCIFYGPKVTLNITLTIPETVLRQLQLSTQGNE